MSEKYEELIETGDMEKYKTMMHLAQFVHVVFHMIKPHVNYYPDRLTVELADKSPVWNSNACLKAQHPIDGSLLVSYFEMKVVSIGERGSVAIGLCQNNFPSNRIPGISGMAGFSVCYNSSGEVCESGDLVEKLKKYKTGDVVGCGLNSYTGEIFFTLNAEVIGSKIINKAEIELYACVGLNAISSSVAVSFGKTSFAFDLENVIRQTKKQIIEQILDQEIKSEDVNLLILNYLEVYGYNQTLTAFNQHADTHNQHLVHKRDFKTIDKSNLGPEEKKPQRKFTEDLIGLELSRIESIDFWTPEQNQRKASIYSNSGTERPPRKMSGESNTDLISKRYSLKQVVLTQPIENIKTLLDSQLNKLVKDFPEIHMQVEMLDLKARIAADGLVAVLQGIKERYSDLAVSDLLLYQENKILHLTLPNLVSKIVMCRNPEQIGKLLNPDDCRQALWEKLNASILSKNKVHLEHSEYLAISNLDVISGHFDFLKESLKTQSSFFTRLTDKPADFRHATVPLMKHKDSNLS